MTGGEGEGVRAKSFRPDIQGLRAIAVGSVLLYHAGVPFLPGGYVGVDVFFVISGFLITTQLLGRLRHEGRVRLGSFYARRARRILPASFAVLVLSVIAALIWYPPLLMEEVWQGAVATALYVPNYLFAVDGTNYLSETTPSLFQHYWSLGIEEQFYLVWPAMLALGFLVSKHRRVVFTLIATLVILSFAAGAWLTSESQPWAFFSLPTRAWELGAGGLLAFMLVRRSWLTIGPASGAVTGWLGIAGIVAAAVLFSEDTAFPGYSAAVPVASTALVILAGTTASPLAPAGMLSLRGFQFVGLISYSLYLVHWPMLLIPQVATGTGEDLPLWLSLAITALCVPVAWLLYRFVENPARGWGWLTRARPRRTLLAALAGSLASIAIASASFSYSNSRPLFVPEDAPSTDVQVMPTGTAFVPANMSPPLRQASRDQPVLYDDGCHLGFAAIEPANCVYGDPTDPRIILFGDSHAAQWAPALIAFGETNGYSIETHTKSACAAADLQTRRDGVPYRQCDQWRDAVIDHVNATAPALVIIANSTSHTIIDTNGRPRDFVWDEALTATLEAIAPPTVVLADTPLFETSPSICLSANLNHADACSRAASEALGESTRTVEEHVSVREGIGFISLNDYFCNSEVCPTIIGNTLVYRDENHITATWSAKLSEPLAAALQPYLR